MSQFALTFPGGKHLLDKDITDNDSDKTVTVPAGKQWLVTCITCHYVADAAAGNRRIQMRITDGTDEYFRTHAGDILAATEDVWFIWLPGKRDTVIANLQTFQQSLPEELLLPAGHTIQVLDEQVIAVAADDMHVFIIGREIDAP